MGFEELREFLGESSRVGGILHIALLCWLLWITRQVHLLREDVARLAGEVDVIRNGKKVVIGG